MRHASSAYATVEVSMDADESRGARTFALVLFGQFISLVGSSLTTFALGVWVYERTGSTTEYALISFFITVPGILMSPVAGALVDRWDRRLAMMLSDSGAACSTLFIAVLLLAGRLDTWHIYFAAGVGAVFTAFQYPAYMAASTLLISKKHYARASGLMALTGALGYLVAPVLGAWLLVMIHMAGVILIDFVTFLFSLLTLSVVRFPPPPPSAEGKQGSGTLLQEAAYGWLYIKARQGLLALLILFAMANLFIGLANVLMVPLILSFTSVKTLGAIGSISTSGFLVGGAVMSIWGGPKRRIRGIFAFGGISGLAMAIAGLSPSILLVAGGMWGLFFCGVIIDACSQAIWQSKVAPDIQGRVFSVRAMIAQSTLPLAYLLAGPLADTVFEPLLTPTGPLSHSVGRVIGTGSGRGTGLLFIVLGVALLLTVIGAALYPHLRNVEDELPDYAARGLSEPESVVEASPAR
jgi:DHA3 family macrolide efflux protein-like MFS transporter